MSARPLSAVTEPGISASGASADHRRRTSCIANLAVPIARAGAAGLPARPDEPFNAWAIADGPLAREPPAAAGRQPLHHRAAADRRDGHRRRRVPDPRLGDDPIALVVAERTWGDSAMAPSRPPSCSRVLYTIDSVARGTRLGRIQQTRDAKGGHERDPVRRIYCGARRGRGPSRWALPRRSRRRRWGEDGSDQGVPANLFRGDQDPEARGRSTCRSRRASSTSSCRLAIIIVGGLLVGAPSQAASKKKLLPWEAFVEIVYDFSESQIGRASLPAKTYTTWFPYLATLFLFIWINNLISVLLLPVNTEHKIWGVIPQDTEPVRGDCEHLGHARAHARDVFRHPRRRRPAQRRASPTSRAGFRPSPWADQPSSPCSRSCRSSCGWCRSASGCSRTCSRGTC